MRHDLNTIEGLVRFENTELTQVMRVVKQMSKDSFAYEEVHGQLVHVWSPVACEPVELFDYMQDARSLNEWTYSVRQLEQVSQEGLFMGIDAIGGEGTKIFVKVEANREALTVDYHCAWDQGEELWMVYLMRIVPAQTVLHQPGSVVFWANCKHPYYEANPHPELAPPDRPWAGQFWNTFYAGHSIELENLKRIAEHRFPLSPR